MEVAEVEEVCEADVGHAVKHGGLDVGKTRLEILEKLSDEGAVARLLKLSLVGTGLDARIVGDERKLVDATLRNETQRTNETLGGGVGGNVGTHRLQAAAAEQRDEQRDTEVVELLAQSQAVAVQAVGQGVRGCCSSRSTIFNWRSFSINPPDGTG